MNWPTFCGWSSVSPIKLVSISLKPWKKILKRKIPETRKGINITKSWYPQVLEENNYFSGINDRILQQIHEMRSILWRQKLCQNLYFSALLALFMMI